MQLFISVLKKYAVFTGRARRKEYWMFMLFNIIIALVIGVLFNIILLLAGVEDTIMASSILSWIYTLAVFCPTLGVTIRRLHDIGRSGWYVLLELIPLVGVIIVLVWAAKEGVKGENQYGPDPKAFAADIFKKFFSEGKYNT